MTKDPNLSEENAEIPDIDVFNNYNPNSLFIPKCQTQEVQSHLLS